jgi:hypothetical protein
MDPAETYVSLIYTSPGTGPTACQATPELTFTLGLPPLPPGVMVPERIACGPLHIERQD